MKPVSVFFLLIAVCCSLLVSGCGNKQKLGGRVVFSDGEPLGIGTVFFSNENFLARAHLKSDGTYDVGSLSDKDGLPPGTYKVFITDAIETIRVGPEVKQTESFKPLVARKFCSAQTTPLTITIPGEKTFEITVERPE